VVLTARFQIIGVHSWTKTESLVDGETTDVKRGHAGRRGDKNIVLFNAVEKSSKEGGLTGTILAGNQNVLAGINPVESILKLVSDRNSHRSSPKVFLVSSYQLLSAFAYQSMKTRQSPQVRIKYLEYMF